MAYINLRQYSSDGSMARWPRGLRHSLVHPPVAFLGNLERAFARQFTFREMPQGYAVYNEARTNTTNRAHDTHVYGHPNGHFLSARAFSLHVRWLMQGRAGRCLCTRCRQGYREALRAAAARRNPPPRRRFWQIPEEIIL
ncbi:hypothetical protein D6C77_09678 [Aureobasidium pullulans]|nr:hypothetical protein D6C77_09678 [Aureobasidium pullulans]